MLLLSRQQQHGQGFEHSGLGLLHVCGFYSAHRLGAALDTHLRQEQAAQQSGLCVCHGRRLSGGCHDIHSAWHTRRTIGLG